MAGVAEGFQVVAVFPAGAEDFQVVVEVLAEVVPEDHGNYAPKKTYKTIAA